MIHKRRYLFILEIAPLETGKIYAELPSHLTLMSRFWSELSPDELAGIVRPLFQNARLGDLPDVIRKAAQARAPHILVGYLLELSQIHGRFYETSRVIGLEDQELATMRLALHAAYKVVIENGLNLLNIPLSSRL